MLEVKQAHYKYDYIIAVEFNNNKKADINLQEFIKTTPIRPFKRLEDKAIFQKFVVDYTIKWDEELDIAPEYLYYEAFKNDENLREQFKKWGYIN